MPNGVDVAVVTHCFCHYPRQQQTYSPLTVSLWIQGPAFIYKDVYFIYMPNKKNRNNAHQERQSVSTEPSPQVNPYHSPTLFEFDSPSPALAVNDLPALDTPVSPDPLPVPLPDPGRRILAAERDLIDMHGSPAVREDPPIEDNVSLPHSLPPAVTFDLTREEEAKSPTSLGERYQSNREGGHVRSPVLARYVVFISTYSNTSLWSFHSCVTSRLWLSRPTPRLGVLMGHCLSHHPGAKDDFRGLSCCCGA